MINNLNICLLLIMTLFGAIGGVYFKKYSTKRIRYLFLGLSFYGIGALLNIFLLKELPYTVVFLANALTYVWALLLANLIFKETIGLFRIIGVILIATGLIILVI